MEYNGKESRTVYHPYCTYGDNANFFNAALFSNKIEAEHLIEEWIFNATRFNPEAFRVEKTQHIISVYTKRDNRLMYEFSLCPMALFD